MKKDGFYTRNFEKLDPLVALGLGGLTYWYASTHLTAIDLRLCGDRTTLYGPLVGTFGALLGFVIAAFSVISTLVQDERLALLRAKGVEERIWRVFVISAAWCGLATLTSIFALVFDRSGGNSPPLLSVLVFACASATFSICRCVQILHLVGRVVRSRPNAPSRGSAS